MDFSDELKIRQDLWDESPCSLCSEMHCCKNLPLTPLRLNSQNDFVNLILTSSYNGMFPVYKRTGEWTFYLKGQCTIHKSAHQSLICKSYDAHTCWYVEAFSTERFSTMIIWFEKKYKLIEHNDGTFSFDRLIKEHNPFSGIGEQWIILKRSDLETLKNMTVFNDSGKVRHIPVSSEILHALKSENPNRVA